MTYSARWDVVHQKELCRICLQPHHGRCKSGKKCEAPECNYMHNTSLHKSPSSVNSKDSPNETPTAVLNLHQRKSGPSLLKIVPVKLFGPKQTVVNTFALLDDGSSLSLMEDSVADELGLIGPVKPLCLQWTNDKKRTELNSKCVDLSIAGVQGEIRYDLWNVHTVKNLSLPQQTVNFEDLKREFQYLNKVPMSSYHNAKPTILIGLDNPRFSVATKAKYGGELDPVAIHTRLGWIVFGTRSQASERILHICDCHESLDQLDKSVKDFITLDTIGTKNITPISEVDKKVIEIMEKTLAFDGEKYSCDLLWRFKENRLPSNYEMALKRLRCLQKRLQKETGLRELVEFQLSEYERKGYIKRVDNSYVNNVGDNCWYLPIFPVRNPNKPNKLRLVWDAAASVNNISLNSVLLKGPDLLTSLPGVLLRFREKQFAVAGDIMEMFHQIKVNERDQRYQLFLWEFPNGTVVTYAMTVMTFKASCSPFMAQYVKNHHARKYENVKPRAVTAIVQNHYVDDWLDCFDSEAEATTVANEVKDIYSAGGFHIRNWISNSRLVLENLGETESLTKSLCDKLELNSEKVLGLWWNVNKDTFTFTLKYNKGTSEILKGERIPTKREMLRIIMSVYDPLGFLSHFIIFAKILMQNTWRAAIGWDDVIPLKLQTDWSDWVQKLHDIGGIQLSRWYLSPSFKDPFYELHTFVDASEEAYSAVVYLRVHTGENVMCRLITAKSKTAPLKSLTVPRLELNAALLGTRLAKSVEEQQSIKFEKRFFWSDSKTVICWIRSETRNYKQYVSCRVGEILEDTI